MKTRASPKSYGLYRFLEIPLNIILFLDKLDTIFQKQIRL